MRKQLRIALVDALLPAEVDICLVTTTYPVSLTPHLRRRMLLTYKDGGKMQTLLRSYEEGVLAHAR
jgi:hypothetical protein